MLFQALAIALVRSPTRSYSLGLNTGASCVFLFAALLFQDAQLLQAPSPLGAPHNSAPQIVLLSVQLIASIFAAFTSISLPRRPAVFHNGLPVDGMLTRSALDRFGFSWVEPLLMRAKKTKRLELQDLPTMAHYTRSKDLSRLWARHDHPRKLWLEIFLAYKWPLATQWFLTLLSAFGVFAPQFALFHIIRILEPRLPGEKAPAEAWVWVLALTLASIGQSWIESWLFWVSWSELAVPVRAQISALIFQKAMRRKDVKGASKALLKDSRDGPDVLEAAQGDTVATDKPEIEEEEEEEGDPKSKQSTVNLIGVDSKRVADFCSFNNYFPGSLFKLLVSFAFLWSIIGWKALLAGFLAMALTIPINIFFSKRYAAAQDRLMKVRDTKMAVVTEALQGTLPLNLVCCNC